MQLSSTDIAAWWGAIVATLVFVWDIYKWKNTGPKIKLSASPNRQIIGNPKFAGKTYVIVEAMNKGDRSTTLTNLELAHYKSQLQRRLGNHSQIMAIPHPGLSNPLPYELQPGAVWQGLVLQDGDFERVARKGYLYVSLSYSNSDRPKMARVQVDRSSPRERRSQPSN